MVSVPEPVDMDDRTLLRTFREQSAELSRIEDELAVVPDEHPARRQVLYAREIGVEIVHRLRRELKHRRGLYGQIDDVFKGH